MKEIILIGILFLFTQACIGQQLTLTDYTPIISIGNLPDVCIKKEKISIEHIDKKAGDKVIDEYLKENNANLTSLFQNERILYNDTVSKYLNKVATIITNESPELKGQLQFFLLESNEVNAYSLSNGCILVTTALIAQIENEAQLAYILCHEIIHYP